MSDPDEPGRLLDSTGDPMLRELLAAAQSELPTPEQLAEIASRLPLAGGGGGGGSGPGPSTATKLVLGLGALSAVGVIVAAVVVSSTRPAETRVAAPAPPAASTSSTPEPAASAPPEPSASAPPAPSPRITSPRDAAPAASEIELLKRAQDALGTDPSTALKACAEHAKLYPRGDLAQEREVLAVDALMRLGRKDAALRRARAFVAAHPGSSHQARLERLVGETL